MKQVNPKSRSGLRPDPAPKRRAAEIIDAAAAVFAEKSFHGSTTQDIADRLGIRQASLYYYLASKDEALAEVCRLGVEGYLENAQKIAAGPGDATVKLAALIRSHLAPMNMKPDYVKVFLCERQHLAGPQRRAIGRVAGAYEAVIEAVIGGAVAQGEFAAATDPRLATLALLGMCNEATRWINTDRGADMEKTAAAFAAMLLGGLKRRPGPAGAAPPRPRYNR